MTQIFEIFDAESTEERPVPSGQAQIVSPCDFIIRSCKPSEGSGVCLDFIHGERGLPGDQVDCSAQRIAAVQHRGWSMHHFNLLKRLVIHRCQVRVISETIGGIVQTDSVNEQQDLVGTQSPDIGRTASMTCFLDKKPRFLHEAPPLPFCIPRLNSRTVDITHCNGQVLDSGGGTSGCVDNIIAGMDFRMDDKSSQVIHFIFPVNHNIPGVHLVIDMRYCYPVPVRRQVNQ